MRRITICLLCAAFGMACGSRALARGATDAKEPIHLVEVRAHKMDLTVVVRVASADPGGRILVEEPVKVQREELPADLQGRWADLKPIANVQVFSCPQENIDKVLKDWDSQATVGKQSREVVDFGSLYSMKIFVSPWSRDKPITIVYPTSPGKPWGYQTIMGATTDPKLPVQGSFEVSVEGGVTTGVLTISSWPAGDPLILQGP